MTFSQNNKLLDKKVKDLEDQNKNTDYIIKGKLQEKDEELNELKKQMKLDKYSYITLADKVSKLINGGIRQYLFHASLN